MKFTLIIGVLLSAVASAIVAGPTTEPSLRPPVAGQVLVDRDRGDVLLHAVVQHPSDKPCIDAFGQRVQAFIGCSRAAGADATMAAYFVFLVDAPTEDVSAGLIALGARSRVAYSMKEGHRRAGLSGKTTAVDYLQGDPVTLSVFWDDHGTWIERPYQDFCTEQVSVSSGASAGSAMVEKPWTPSFVFHNSGSIYASGTGCIACPCDCAGGIIADNRMPIYEPKPTVKFDTSLAPPAGTTVYIRIHPMCPRPPTTQPAAGGELLQAKGD